ncbi:hypothetical protein FS837_006850 [Tulasnella sp. UAMH 9824]|nr:hypothetical protein FS837_006850 [Tulasnella sp. UAMH 9824]
MVLRDRLAPNDGGLPPESLVTSRQLPQQPADRVREQGFDKITNSLRNGILEIIKSTEWPLESRMAAKGFIETVESSPDVPNDMNNIPQDIDNLIKQYIQYV